MQWPNWIQPTRPAEPLSSFISNEETANMSQAKTTLIGMLAILGVDDLMEIPREPDKGDGLGRSKRVVGWSKVTPSKRVGRNTPCSCGSGQKSKKCCRGNPLDRRVTGKMLEQL